MNYWSEFEKDRLKTKGCRAHTRKNAYGSLVATNTTKWWQKCTGVWSMVQWTISRTHDDVLLINIHELGVLACSRYTGQGTEEISHMYYNRASWKSMANNHLIGLDDEKNTREVFNNNNHINPLCLYTSSWPKRYFFIQCYALLPVYIPLCRSRDKGYHEY